MTLKSGSSSRTETGRSGTDAGQRVKNIFSLVREEQAEQKNQQHGHENISVETEIRGYFQVTEKRKILVHFQSIIPESAERMERSADAAEINKAGGQKKQ